MNILYDSMGHMVSSSENMLLLTDWENSTQSALFKLNWVEGDEVLCAFCGLRREWLSEFKEIMIGK